MKGLLSVEHFAGIVAHLTAPARVIINANGQQTLPKRRNSGEAKEMSRDAEQPRKRQKDGPARQEQLPAAPRIEKPQIENSRGRVLASGGDGVRASACESVAEENHEVRV